MSSFLDKIKMKVATLGSHPEDLSCDHVTSMDFMEFNVAFNQEMQVDSSIKMNQQSFTRLLPLPQPTFGTVTMHNRSYFVKYTDVWKPFLAYYLNARFCNGQTSNIPLERPYIPNSVLTGFYLDPSVSSVIPVINPMPAKNYDFISDVSGSNMYHKLTSFGRYCHKIFRSLGYAPDFGAVMDKNDYHFDALPLLCVAKVALDWYYPPQYADLVPIYNDVKNLMWQLDTFSLSVADLTNIFQFMRYVGYDSDRFVSVFDSPVAPNSGSFTDISITDPTQEGSSNGGYRTQVSTVSDGNDVSLGTPHLRGTAISNGIPSNNIPPYNISEASIKMLERVSDYLHRNSLAGSRVVDRFLARFGKQLSNEHIWRSSYVGRQNIVIQFGDVMSHSDTAGAALGDYAGKGLGFGDDGNFEFWTVEPGQFIVISSLVPRIGYVQGIDRNLLSTTYLQEWQPEYDNVSVDAVGKGELYMPFHDVPLNNGYAKSIFGFLHRYYYKKIARDRLSGNFTFASSDPGRDCYYLFRMFNNSSNLSHNAAFMKGNDAAQYNRIFNAIESNQDYFNVIHRFNIKYRSHMLPLWENLDWHSGGKEITMDTMGTKVN